MKKIIKECKNPDCCKFGKMIKITDKTDVYCTSCGEPLYHVCKSCHKRLNDDSKVLCEHCKMKKKDNAKKVGGAAAGAVGIAGAVGVAAVKTVQVVGKQLLHK